MFYIYQYFENQLEVIGQTTKPIQPKKNCKHIK